MHGWQRVVKNASLRSVAIGSRQHILLAIIEAGDGKLNRAMPAIGSGILPCIVNGFPLLPIKAEHEFGKHSEISGIYDRVCAQQQMQVPIERFPASTADAVPILLAETVATRKNRPFKPIGARTA